MELPNPVALRTPDIDRITAHKTLEGDIECLRSMETDGERFGEGVSLDSVSTFESIVEGVDHFFMEMNTRIQVEHGVSELVYRLKFTNPDDAEDFFYVERLIEAFAMVGVTVVTSVMSLVNFVFAIRSHQS